MSHILIVEDDITMSRLYQRVFAREGYTIENASDGEDGLTKVQANPPDLILLDIMMPKMNGFQLLEKLKEKKETRNIPVIMLTNLTGPQDMENALSRGAIKYLIKSELEPKQLASIIKEVMAGIPTAESPPVTAISSDSHVPTSTSQTASPAPAPPATLPTLIESGPTETDKNTIQ